MEATNPAAPQRRLRQRGRAAPFVVASPRRARARTQRRLRGVQTPPRVAAVSPAAADITTPDGVDAVAPVPSLAEPTAVCVENDIQSAREQTQRSAQQRAAGNLHRVLKALDALWHRDPLPGSWRHWFGVSPSREPVNQGKA